MQLVLTFQKIEDSYNVQCLVNVIGDANKVKLQVVKISQRSE